VGVGGVAPPGKIFWKKNLKGVTKVKIYPPYILKFSELPPRLARGTLPNPALNNNLLLINKI
jgi:hypothetical protein